MALHTVLSVTLISSILLVPGLTKIANMTATGVIRYLRTSKATKLLLVVEKTVQNALLAMPDFPADRVVTSNDKRLFYERGGCGLYYY